MTGGAPPAASSAPGLPLRLPELSRLRQESLDAALNLLAMRRRLLGEIDQRGHPNRPAIEVVGIGIDEVRRNLSRRDMRETLGISPRLSEESLRYSHEADRAQIDRGSRIVGLFDLGGVGPVAHGYLHDRELNPHVYLSVAPVQMKIVDRRCVVVEGPEIRGERTALAVSDPTMLGFAWEYWNFVWSTAVRAQDVVDEDPMANLTPRQREIAWMMADDLTDAVIALRLNCSLRTVRYEVAALLRLLNARSRFGAGLRLGRLEFEHVLADVHGEA
jgi:DNA-binding CsgD family transcriptional regulator